MLDVLKTIVASKDTHIAQLRCRFPESTFSHCARRHSLHATLKAVRPAFILECKHASPSNGVLRQSFDIPAMVTTYNRYASAISVVTDTDFFQGDFDYLAQARANTRLPVLCKDFFISPYQIRLASHLGADAVLLMLSVLEDDHYLDLLDVAAYCGLEVLTEISNETELERALQLNACTIGINNRDLRTLSIDLDTTRRLAPQIPAHCALVSESGIDNHEQVLQLARHVDGFLVGSSLMRATDLDRACASLIHGDNELKNQRGVLA